MNQTVINCSKCNKTFKNEKFLANHNHKYANCNIGKYNCEKCNFNTHKLYNYNQHLQSKIHMSMHNVCQFCLKQFRDNRDYLRHMNRKIKCFDIINNNNIKNNLDIQKYPINNINVIVGNSL